MSRRPSNVYPTGGHDCDFVVPPPENLHCPICHLVFNDPHLTDCCGHHFCHSCILKSLQMSQVCPLCQREFEIFPAKNVTREVNALQVKCTHKKGGCEWQGEWQIFIYQKRIIRIYGREGRALIRVFIALMRSR